MKKIFIILLLLVFSCSKPIDKQVDVTNAKICQIIKNDFSVKSFLEAKKLFQLEIIDLNVKSLDKNKLPEYYSRLRQCFPGIKYSKTIKNILDGNTNIESNIKSLNIINNKFDLVLEGEQTPAFNMKFRFKAGTKLPDTTNLEISGKILFFDKDKQMVEQYNLYPTPDFFKYSKLAYGEFTHIAYFDAVWNPYSETPFDEAATVLDKINKVEYFKIVMNFSGNPKLDKKLDKETKQDKKDEEIIDKIEIK